MIIGELREIILRSWLMVLVIVVVAARPTVAYAQDPTAAAAAVAKGDYAVAIEQYTKLVGQNPSDARWSEQLGIAYLQVGKYAEARQSLQEAIDKGFVAPAGKYNLACAYARLGEKRRALDLLGELVASGAVFAIGSDPDFASLSDEPKFKDLVSQVQRNRQPCKDAQLHPEYRQFDFWVGDWDVFSGNQKVGENHVQSILGGCVVFENWRSSAGGEGKSFNKFNPVTKEWEQFWVADNGTTLHYVGQLVDGEMRYSFESHTPAGQVLLNHLTFSRVSENRVRQLSQVSTDAGKTWSTGYDFIYVKKLENRDSSNMD